MWRARVCVEAIKSMILEGGRPKYRGIPPPGMPRLVAQNLVLVYAKREHDTYELLRACLAPVEVSPGPPALAGGVCEVGGVGGARDAYRRALLSSVFCYLLTGGDGRGSGSRAVAYSMRPDGSVVCRVVRMDDPGLGEVMERLPQLPRAGSDELCPTRPGPKFEVSYTAPVVTYMRARSGELHLHSSSNVPCNRMRLSRWVGPGDYVCGGRGGGANAGITCFRDHVQHARAEYCRLCTSSATLVVVRPGGATGGGGHIGETHRERDMCGALRPAHPPGGPARKRKRSSHVFEPGEPPLELPGGPSPRSDRRHAPGGCSFSPPGAAIAMLVQGEALGSGCPGCGAPGGGGGWRWLWRGGGVARAGVRWLADALAACMDGAAWGGGMCACQALDSLPYASDEAMGVGGVGGVGGGG